MTLANGIYKGKKLVVTINNIDYSLDATNISIKSEDLDSDALTYGAYTANGGKQWFMEISAIQDLATGSLWRYVWDNAGLTAVPFKMKVYGGGSATATAPFVTGTFTVGEKPDMLGDPKSVWKFDTRFDIDGTPTLQVTGV